MRAEDVASDHGAVERLIAPTTSAFHPVTVLGERRRLRLDRDDVRFDDLAFELRPHGPGLASDAL